MLELIPQLDRIAKVQVHRCFDTVINRPGAKNTGNQNGLYIAAGVAAVTALSACGLIFVFCFIVRKKKKEKVNTRVFSEFSKYFQDDSEDDIEETDIPMKESKRKSNYEVGELPI